MRTFTCHAQWLALALILTLGLTACFQSAGEDVPPTQPGGMVPANQMTAGPSPTPLGLPTGLTETATEAMVPTVESETPLASPVVAATDTATAVQQLGSTPTPTLTVTAGGLATSTPPATSTPRPTFTPQPTFTSPPVQATFTPLPTYTSLPTYTPLPTYTEPPIEPTLPGIWPGGPTATYTPFPRVTFGPTSTYTLPPGASLPDGQGGFAGEGVAVQPTQPPQEGIPLAERTTPTLASGGIGGPFSPTPAAVDEPVSFSPTPIGGNPPVPTATAAAVAQVASPTQPLSPGQMTATLLVYQATATGAATQGLPSPVPPGQPTPNPLAQPTQPGVQSQPLPQGNFPANATVITATPFGQPGICEEHLVQPGETLTRIALRYGVTVNEIAAANNLTNTDLIEAGDTLLIPCYVPPTATPVVVPVVTGVPGSGGQAGAPGVTVVPSQPQIYTVQPGDNIYQISLRFGVDMSELVAANGLNAVTMNMIYVGQELIIPGTSTTIIVTATPFGTPAAPALTPTLTPFIIVVTSAP